MEEARVATERRKPRMILTARFPVVHSMELGENGNLDVVLQAESESLDMDDSMNEVRSVRFVVLSATDITARKARDV